LPHVATTHYNILTLCDSAIHNASSLWVTVGEFRKTCHPRNVKVYEIREMSFQGNLRRSGILNLRSSEVANVRRSGISNLRSSEVVNVRRSGISNLRSFKVANSRRPEVMNLQNHEIGSLRNSGICWRSSSEVTAHEDFLNGEIHKSVRSKVKDVVSKSPGLVCELVAGL
jgi:hypothetical protein